jgi:hypothetical protein
MRVLAATLMVIFASFPLSSRADDGFEIALKLAKNNFLCGKLHGAVLLYARPNWNPSAEICTFYQSIVKTQSGLRFLFANSFADEKGLPDMHGIYWVDVDCVAMLTRYSDGYYYSVSKSLEALPSSKTKIYRLANGWNIYSTPKRRGEWESLKSYTTDRAKTKACSLYFGKNR